MKRPVSGSDIGRWHIHPLLVDEQLQLRAGRQSMKNDMRPEEAAPDEREEEAASNDAALKPLPRASASATVIAAIAVIGALWWGQRFAIPLVAGLLLAILVAPLVALTKRAVRSRVLATVVALTIVIATLVAAGFAFGGQLLKVTERVPEMISLAADRLTQTEPNKNTLLNRVRSSLAELDTAANRLTRGQRPPSRVKVVLPPANSASAPTPISDSATVALRETAVSGSSMLLKFAGDLTVILLIAFFVLCGGPELSDRLVDQWGYSPMARGRAQAALRECSRQVRLYVGVLVVTNSMIGLSVWAVFSISGLPDAGGWGVTAAVLHVIPYLGMGVLMGLGAAETFLAHGTLASAIGMAAFLLVLSTLIGTVVTAWLQGRAAQMSAAAVFIGLVFWGAMWGLWGLFLGPILIVLAKVIAEHSRSGRRLARLMAG
jgi:predicted PurR-regulated permease PerM